MCRSKPAIALTFSLLPGMLSATLAHAELFPAQTLYPQYVADPLRPTFSAKHTRFAESSIAGTGDDRFDLKLGGSLPLYTWHRPARQWQLVLLAGFHGQFDNTQSQDNIGWDGIYGLHVSTSLSDTLQLRLGSKHISAHVGDEYIQSTGRTRIEYTREELRAGLAWAVRPAIVLYGEIARAYDLRNEQLQRRGRAQLGAQYESTQRFWHERIVWYLAADVSAYQENNWDRNLTLQTGVSAHSGAHRWRLGLEFYDGRSQLGEFFQDQERYWALGLWFDL